MYKLSAYLFNTSNVTYLIAYTCFPSPVHYIIALKNIHEKKSAARLTSHEINPILRDINRAKHKSYEYAPSQIFFGAHDKRSIDCNLHCSRLVLVHFYVLPCLKVYRRFMFMCAPYIHKFNRSVFYPV